MGEIRQQNLPSPVALAFALGIFASVIRHAVIAFVANIDVVRGEKYV